MKMLHVKSLTTLVLNCLSRSSVVYAVRMLFFGLALLIAARPDLDNPGCYRDGWDYFRGICEAISLMFFLFNLVSEILEMIRYVWLHLCTLSVVHGISSVLLECHCMCTSQQPSSCAVYGSCTSRTTTTIYSSLQLSFPY